MLSILCYCWGVAYGCLLAVLIIMGCIRLRYCKEEMFPSSVQCNRTPPCSGNSHKRQKAKRPSGVSRYTTTPRSRRNHLQVCHRYKVCRLKGVRRCKPRLRIYRYRLNDWIRHRRQRMPSRYANNERLPKALLR